MRYSIQYDVTTTHFFQWSDIPNGSLFKRGGVTILQKNTNLTDGFNAIAFNCGDYLALPVKIEPIPGEEFILCHLTGVWFDKEG